MGPTSTGADGAICNFSDGLGAMSSKAEKSAPGQTRSCSDVRSTTMPTDLDALSRFGVTALRCRGLFRSPTALGLTVPRRCSLAHWPNYQRLSFSVSVERTCSRHPVRCEWHWGEPDQILSFGAGV